METKTVKIDELKPSEGIYVQQGDMVNDYTFYTLEKFRKVVVKDPENFGKAYLAVKVKPTPDFNIFREMMGEYVEQECINIDSFVVFDDAPKYQGVLDDKDFREMYHLLVEMMEKTERFQRKTEIEIDWSNLIKDGTPEKDAAPEKIKGTQSEQSQVACLFLNNAIEAAMKCNDDEKKKIGEWLYKMSFRVRGL